MRWLGTHGAEGFTPTPRNNEFGGEFGAALTIIAALILAALIGLRG